MNELHPHHLPSALLDHQTVDRCHLATASEAPPAHCDGETCMYWRVLGHIGIEAEEQTGCAIRYYELLSGDSGPGVAAWLLSVKQRVESVQEVR